MSLLADALYAAPRFGVQKKNLDARIQYEIEEAKRIQAQVKCSWSEALRIARG